MTEISQELAGRMAALIRDLHADHLTYDLHDRVQDFVARTAAIVAELPKDDPDLIEARKMAAAGLLNGPMAAGVIAGEYDKCSTVFCRLEGIKRGRELALSLDAESGK